MARRSSALARQTNIKRLRRRFVQSADRDAAGGRQAFGPHKATSWTDSHGCGDFLDDVVRSSYTAIGFLVPADLSVSP